MTMPTRFLTKALILSLLLAGELAAPVLALVTPAQEPLFLTRSARPKVMLAMSADRQLFVKAYPDYTDLDGDGSLDIGYTDTFDYYGYFQHNRCYTYDSVNEYFYIHDSAGFEATGANDHYCTATGADTTTHAWSGNFLNWAAMTRIDVLRRALYGGKRVVDTINATVLERAFLPRDVHSFGKVFEPDAGDDSGNYTPYASKTELTVCNTTPTTETNPPEIRFAEGDWFRWSANEVTQCNWDENVHINAGDSYAPNQATLLGLGKVANELIAKVSVCRTNVEEDWCQYYENSNVQKPVGLLQQFGEDDTLQFGLLTGSYYNRAEGGIVREDIEVFEAADPDTGVFYDPDDGDATTPDTYLVKTLDQLEVEGYDYNDAKYLSCDKGYVNDVDYYLSPDNRVPDLPPCKIWGNPIGEIYYEAIRYLRGEGTPTAEFAASDLNIGPSQSDLNSVAAWSDPMPSDEWCAPLNVVLIATGGNSFDTLADNAPNNALFDLNDQDIPSGDGTSTVKVSAATDAIGVYEGLPNTNVFIGDTDLNDGADANEGYCTPTWADGSNKVVGDLSDLRGLCPAQPAFRGGYGMAGIAHKAYTTDLRAVGAAARGNDPDTGEFQNIDTFILGLARDLPEFEFDLDGQTVKVVPIAQQTGSGNYSGAYDATLGWTQATFIDLKIEELDTDWVQFLVHWEGRMWGGDHDMDIVSRHSICVGTGCNGRDGDGDGLADVADNSVPASQMRVTTWIPHVATTVNVVAGTIISGSASDGVYFTGIKPSKGYYRFDGDPGDLNKEYWHYSYFTPDAWAALAEPTKSIEVFNKPGVGVTPATLLESPLFYTAKYGSFDDKDDDGWPSSVDEWDEENNATGAVGPDGLPDNYFFADDPSDIGPKLNEYLNTIATTASASSVVANSVALDTTTRLYQARFDSSDWSGQVLSFPVDITDGSLQAYEWDVGEELANQVPANRNIFTYDPADLTGTPGRSFLLGSLNADQQDLLNDGTINGNTADAQDILDYVRGDATNERQNGGDWRDRSTPLGDVVHSTPILVAEPNMGYPETIEPTSSYTVFALNNINRKRMLYFGASDGMLHAASAETKIDDLGQPVNSDGGQEIFAYVPNEVIANLHMLKDDSYDHQYYVDGAPNVVDVFYGGAWHSILVSGLGAGGKAIFALDVTDPANFAVDDVLWEISADTPGFSKLGYTFSQPLVFKTEGGTWVVVFGSGFDAGTPEVNYGAIYMVNVADGSLVSSDTTPSEGVGPLTPIDTNGNGLVDLIYAADLTGKIWRYEVDANGDFDLADGSLRSLLYEAKYLDGANTIEQRITTRIAVGEHPTFNVGRMLTFGTGRYYRASDSDPATALENTFYGIWDKDDGTQVTTVLDHTQDGVEMLRQEIITQTVYTGGGYSYDVRVVSDNVIDWSSHRGWFLDLPTSGEKMVTDPILRGGRLIFITNIPSEELCDAGGTSWLMEIDYENGGRRDEPVFDLNGDGVFDFNDYVTVTDGQGNVTFEGAPSGKKSKSGILQPPSVLVAPGGKKEYKFSSGSKGGVIETTVNNAAPYSEGRKSWWQLK